MNDNGDLKYWTLPLNLEPGYSTDIYSLAIDSLIGSVLAYEDKDTLTFDYLDEDIFNSLYKENGECQCNELEFLRDPYSYRQMLYTGTSNLMKYVMEQNHNTLKEMYGSINICDITVISQNEKRCYLNIAGVKVR